MKANITEPQSWQRVIDVEIPEEELKVVCEEKQKDYRKKARLPGFRQGKVPVSIIQSRYGDVIRAEAIEDLIQKSYQSACKDNSITPISEAKVKEIKADEGQPVRFSIETEVDPTIEIKGYNKLKIKATTKKIKPADVDESINSLRERLAENKDVDRPSKKGDMLTIEYENVVIDGELRSDFSNPSYPVELGTGQIKDFDKGLMGHSAGETVDVTIKFPKDYAEGGVAGKTGEFKIKIAKVQEKVLPEVNEEFLKKIGDFADEAAFREQMTKDLEDRELDRAKNEAYNKAIEQLIKSNPFDVPPSRIEHYIDYMIQEAAKYQRDQQPPNREEVAEKYRETAITTIKRFRIIDFIASKEKIKATQEEVDAQIKKLADQYHQPFDEFKAALRKNGTVNRIRSDLQEQKTLDFLIGELAQSEE